jgi:hypothetical protein
MTPFPESVTDAELIAFIDRWAEMLEREDYHAAFAWTDHDPDARWTPELIRKVIKRHDQALPTQKVTLHGRATDVTQRKEVERWPNNSFGCFGEIWYDLNIDGVVSDLTATFSVMLSAAGVTVELDAIHVM